MRRKIIHGLWLVAFLPFVAWGAYYLPPIHSRLAWRLDALRTRIAYMINPPDKAVFEPGGNTALTIETVIATTRAEYSLTLTPQVTQTPNSGPMPTPTITSTPLPATVSLQGVKYEDQHNRWNYCGPANFSMALTFWGWNGNRDVIGKAVKPSDKDRNVMPYEFQDYIAENVPGISTVMRYGADVETVKRLIAAGFPVVAEKGYYERDFTGKMGWMGHYQFITGYDDISRELIVQDTYIDGPNFHINYDKFMEGWRSFDFLMVVVYPTDHEGQVMSLLGPLANEEFAARHALEVAQRESQTLTEIDRFFAWFNMGTSYIALKDYVDAANAYDQAFAIYATLGGDNTTRPYRMMWYQTGPYWAYYYSGRYADVINLANTTLKDTVSEPVLEESLLWRGRALYMAGDTPGAIKDYRAALKVHPQWVPAVQGLQDLGVQP